ncbi:hypothetical protein [Enterococcus timonensis]|uniref:hypothetical protein n=1 Tax=Enterococcus timonensis TaxID=1852364 RepID=UPI0008D8F593|nr:hypothetical protein [Enterococcus timonensis]
MDAVEKMVAQVLAKGQQKVEDYLKKEKNRQFTETQQQLVELEKAAKVTADKSKKALEKDFAQEYSRQETTFRRETLNIKQDYLTKLFEEAITAMNQWPKETYQEFCTQGILQVPDAKNSVVILGEYAKDKLDDTWLAKVNAQKQFPLTFSETFEKKQGGFVVDQEGVEYNFLFSALVNELKETESFTIAEILFKES